MNTPVTFPVIARTREEVIKLWTAALRSGKYEQAQEQLCDGHGFCCLGVLCDLAHKDGGAEWSDDHYFMDEDAELPEVMATWIYPQHKDMGPSSVLHDLARKNDAGASFSELADYIEEHLL